MEKPSKVLRYVTVCRLKEGQLQKRLAVEKAHPDLKRNCVEMSRSFIGCSVYLHPRYSRSCMM